MTTMVIKQTPNGTMRITARKSRPEDGVITIGLSTKTLIRPAMTHVGKRKTDSIILFVSLCNTTAIKLLRINGGLNVSTRLAGIH